MCESVLCDLINAGGKIKHPESLRLRSDQICHCAETLQGCAAVVQLRGV